MGQNAEAEDGRGEEDGDDEDGGGTALPAAASASPGSEWLGGPCMVAWLASLEKPLLREKSEILHVIQKQHVASNTATAFHNC